LTCFAQYPACYPSAVDNIDLCLDGYITLPTNCSCGSPGAVPPTGSTCYSEQPLTCSSSSTCANIKTSGPCIQNGDCGDPTTGFFNSYVYSCQNISVSGVYSLQCAMTLGTQAAGDSCTTSLNCADSIPCTGGICQGTSPGGTCTSSASCAFGNFCDITNQCTPQVAPGGACPTLDACTYGYICGYSGSPTSGKCISLQSVPGGGNCVQTEECQNGFYCNSATGVCTAPPPSFVTCTSTAGCIGIPGSECQCNADGTATCNIGPNFVQPTCNNQFNNLMKCAYQNQCFDDFGGGTCTTAHCLNQLNCYSACAAPILSTGPSECTLYPTFQCTSEALSLHSLLFLFATLFVMQF